MRGWPQVPHRTGCSPPGPCARQPGSLVTRFTPPGLPQTGRPDSAALGAFYRVLGLAVGQMERLSRSPSVCLWEQAVSYMQHHLDCSVSEVARHCGVSESALYSSFQRHGSTPNQTRQTLLTQEARRLLTTTDMSVQDISDALGFSSASYFRKVLRSHYGKTPSQLRKAATKV